MPGKAQAQKAIMLPVSGQAHPSLSITELGNVDSALQAVILAVLLVAGH